MASLEGPGGLQPTALPPRSAEAGATGPFVEPISGQTIARTSDRPVSEWIGSLPRTNVGLSTLDRWQAGNAPAATAGQIRAELFGQIAPQPAGGRLTTSAVDGFRAEMDGVKVGYEMGRIAAGIEARIAAEPNVPHADAAALARELRSQGAAISHGAAWEATAGPAGSYDLGGKCYGSADDMARAAIAHANDPNVTSVRAYTPAMQQRDAQAAMDRAVMGQSSPLGMSWGQTAYLYARGNGASLEGQQRAYALGTGGDALLGIGGAFAGAGAARGGQALPGGQARPNLEPPSRTAPLEQTGGALRAPVGPAPRSAAAERAGASGPLNRATFETYTDGLRADMARPATTDPALTSMIGKLYRPNAQIGSGSTAAAVRQELATGQPVGGAFHSQKAQDAIVALGRWLERNPTASAGDRAAAENVIRDMQNALAGH